MDRGKEIGAKSGDFHFIVIMIFQGYGNMGGESCCLWTEAVAGEKWWCKSYAPSFHLNFVN